MEERRKSEIALEALSKIVTEHNKKSEALDKSVLRDIEEIEKFQSKVSHLLFGDKELGEIGMKEKVDEIHQLLTQARTVRDFFGGFRGPVTMLLLIGGFIALFKTFGGALIGWLTLKP